VNAAPWQIEVATTSLARAWFDLPDDVRARVERELCRDPFYDISKPKCRKHIEVKILNRDCDCHREYRDLEKGHRILYKPDKRRRVIHIWYVGPHPKEKPKRGRGRR